MYVGWDRGWNPQPAIDQGSVKKWMGDLITMNLETTNLATSKIIHQHNYARASTK